MTEKQVMVITGASTGVGQAIALRFANQGYEICALARSVEKLSTLEEQGPGKIFSYPVDIRDGEMVNRTFEQIMAEKKRIDILINNAGVSTAGKPVDRHLIDTIIDTNLKGTLYCTFAALPGMQAQGFGHIFNIASISGVAIPAMGGDGLYVASKHGVVAFSESLGKMVRRDGVLITTICPGGIDTPLWTEDYPYAHDREKAIRPGEVADLIAYILAQPRRTLFKNVIFVPVVEEW